MPGYVKYCFSDFVSKNECNQTIAAIQDIDDSEIDEDLLFKCDLCG